MRSWLRQLAEIRSGLRLLAPHLRTSRWLLALAMVGLTMTTLLEGVGVGLLVPLIALLFGTTETLPILDWLRAVAPGYPRHYYVVACAGAVVAAIATKNLLGTATSALVARVQATTLIELRAALFARLQQAPVDVFERNAAGHLANVFTREATRAVEALSALLNMLQMSAMGAFYLAALVALSAPLGLGAMFLGLVIGSVVALVHGYLRDAGLEVTRSNGALAARLLETFGGVRVIRASGATAYEAARFAAVNRDNAAADERSLRGHAAIPAIIETCAVLGAMVLVSAAYALLVAPGRMTALELSAFGLFLLRLIPIVNRFHSAQGHLVNLIGGVHAVERWLATPTFPSRPFGVRPLQEVREGLALRGLSYRYPVGTEALADVSFDVPAGHMVAIVGRSGSGKSTLASLLLRLREPTGGAILVDGSDYWTIAPESWHRLVAVVEQDVFLFNDTLAANVAYGFPAATREAIVAAVHAAQLDDVVAALPEGLDTVLGERGLTLSGGQRQRLAIARALVRDPAVLVLDEATSHLDTVSEGHIQRALAEATSGRTTVVIAHRLSTVRRADRIIVLERGRVVEQGAWETLERAGGAFAALLQSDLREHDRRRAHDRRLQDRGRHEGHATAPDGDRGVGV